MEKERINNLIRQTMLEAEKAINKGNSPFGAIITDSNYKIISKAYNTQNSQNDPTAHGEINALRKAGKKLKQRKLIGFKAFVNTEPCSMCMSAFIKAGITEVYYGANQEEHNNPDIRAQEVANKCSYPIIVKGGYLEKETKIQVQKARLDNQDIKTGFKKKETIS